MNHSAHCPIVQSAHGRGLLTVQQRLVPADGQRCPYRPEAATQQQERGAQEQGHLLERVKNNLIAFHSIIKARWK
ncbi:hypothetical protein TNCT_470321 [Trichonephila clavata]|uniref:Uncharacterized protein n=1 Tax=Trichonephila clavata TaxID=2740835 RepID=A0A8X6H364_TRICU|nr:hypothetical protein TNCT_470321 [Trichonephila clavata]